MNKRIKIFAVLLVLLLTSIASAYFIFSQQMQKSFSLVNHDSFEVPKGKTASSLINDLYKQNLITSTLHAKIWLKLNPQYAKLKAGLYELDNKETLVSLFEKIVYGPQKSFSVALIEGLTQSDWLITLQNQALLTNDVNEVNALYSQLIALDDFCSNQYSHLEGCFFADTYAYNVGDSISDVLIRAYLAMANNLAQAWAGRFQDIALKTPYELLIMASIIEKETALPAERNVIAGVFNNRLEANMRLQTDPTIIYGVRANYNGDITRKHMRTKTPYNTYMIKGLPITPIAMVGKESLEAAAQPELTEYIYFVAKGDGSHQFSVTLKEHNMAVRTYLLNKGK